jgi:hypothetical protein
VTDSRCGLESHGENRKNNAVPMCLGTQSLKKFAAAMLTVSRRFKVRTNLVTIVRSRDRDTQGQQVASRDIPSALPDHPLAARIHPSVVQRRQPRVISGHLRAKLLPIFMEFQLFPLPGPRYTGSTSARIQGKRRLAA